MANSITARFNDDCKVFVSMSDDTTVDKAVIIDAEGNETDIGGGGGSSDFVEIEISVTIEGTELDASFNDLLALVNQSKIPYLILTEEQSETLYVNEFGDCPPDIKFILSVLQKVDNYQANFYTLGFNNTGEKQYADTSIILTSETDSGKLKW